MAACKKNPLTLAPPVPPKSFAATLPSLAMCIHANNLGERGHDLAVRPEEIQAKLIHAQFDTFAQPRWDKRLLSRAGPPMAACTQGFLAEPPSLSPHYGHHFKGSLRG
jgi:hypothetical protein